MLGDHIASAMARERQRDLVPELRGLERGRGTFGNEDGESTDARAVGPGSELWNRLRSRIGLALTRRPMGRSHTGEHAK